MAKSPMKSGGKGKKPAADTANMPAALADYHDAKAGKKSKKGKGK